MPAIIELSQIKKILPGIDLIQAIEDGFVAYANNQTVVPPVGEMKLDKGEVHIKYGAIKSQPFFVIKIASGFYGNTELGISTSNGCMLIFSQITGQLQCVLLDEGYLTDVRTAIAGSIAAKHLAPSKVTKIGIVGTGIQAKLQLEYLAKVTQCRQVLVWGRSSEGLNNYVGHFAKHNAGEFNVTATNDLGDIQRNCNLIVTTTPSNAPLLCAEYLQPGTHITAVGSDMPDKQELDSDILVKADIVVADSIEQCKLRGEISQAISKAGLPLDCVVQLGDIISGRVQTRSNDDQITIADLTGVAVQDIQIATAVYERLAAC